MDDSFTLSMRGSEKYSCDDIRERASKLGVKPSKYLQNLVEKDIDNRRYEGVISYVTMLLGCCAVILLLLLVIYR